MYGLRPEDHTTLVERLEKEENVRRKGHRTRSGVATLVCDSCYAKFRRSKRLAKARKSGDFESLKRTARKLSDQDGQQKGMELRV